MGYNPNMESRCSVPHRPLRSGPSAEPSTATVIHSLCCMQSSCETQWGHVYAQGNLIQESLPQGS
jgi:hypothetical protein